MKKILFVSIPIIYLFSSCSWQEYFIIASESKNPIYIKYEIEKAENGFMIFDLKPVFRKLNAFNTIDWWNELTIEDQNTSF